MDKNNCSIVAAAKIDGREKCKVFRRTAQQREPVAYITATSEGDYNARWKMYGFQTISTAPKPQTL